MHSAVHRSIARVCVFHKQKQRKNDTRLWTSEYSRGIFAFWFVRSFCFALKNQLRETIGRLISTSFPSFSPTRPLLVPYGAREKERTVRREPGNEVDLISRLTYIPILERLRVTFGEDGKRATSDSCHIKPVQNNSYGRT